MIRLIMIVPFLLISCKSLPTIHVVRDIDYVHATYDQRLKYTLSLMRANELNKNQAYQQKWKIIYIDVYAKTNAYSNYSNNSNKRR